MKYVKKVEWVAGISVLPYEQPLYPSFSLWLMKHEPNEALILFILPFAWNLGITILLNPNVLLKMGTLELQQKKDWSRSPEDVVDPMDQPWMARI